METLSACDSAPQIEIIKAGGEKKKIKLEKTSKRR